MKKKVFCLLFALLLAFSAAGCGMDRTGTDKNEDMLPDSAPMVSPDRDDGVVRDQDGIIGNGDQSGARPSAGASPAPSASPVPTAAPTTAPTTAPSASPKP